MENYGGKRKIDGTAFLAPQGRHDVVLYHTNNGMRLEDKSFNTFLEVQHADALKRGDTLAQKLHAMRSDYKK